MTRRFLASTAFALAASVLIGPALSAQRNSKDGAGLTIPFSTTGVNNGGTADIAGTFTITRFANESGKLVAVGTLAATATDTAGSRSVITEMTLPVTNITSGDSATPSAVITQAVACGILHLELGPLDLDLLGLVVHLNQVVLDVSAQPGSGNLLGNLLCAVANLLNGGSPLAGILNQLVGLLNQIIAAL